MEPKKFYAQMRDTVFPDALKSLGACDTAQKILLWKHKLIEKVFGTKMSEVHIELENLLEKYESIIAFKEEKDVHTKRLYSDIAKTHNYEILEWTKVLLLKVIRETHFDPNQETRLVIRDGPHLTDQTSLYKEPDFVHPATLSYQNHLVGFSQMTGL